MGRLRAETLPCARCGRDGASYNRHQTPERLDGSRWGFAGAICNGCYGALRRNPQAQLMPSHWGPKPKRVKAWELAEAVLAFRDALAGEDEKATEAAFTKMVAMAESVEEQE